MIARYLVGAVLVSCTAGCSYGIKATTDYDTRVDLSNYSTFFMMKGNSSGNPAVDDRLISSVDTAMTGKGWVEVPEGEGQAAVVVHTATDTNHTYETFYDNWGGWRSRWAGSGSGSGFVEDYKAGTVVVTIFDARTKQAIWRGFATGALSDSPQKSPKETEKAVSRMFNHFPLSGIPVAGGQKTGSDWCVASEK